MIRGNAVTVDFEDHLWARSGLRVYCVLLSRPQHRQGTAGPGRQPGQHSVLPGRSSTNLIDLVNVTPSPMLDSVEAYPYWLALTFDQVARRSNSVPAASAFTVTVNGSAVSLADFQPVAVAGNTVRLVLDAPLSSTDVLTVSYAKPSGSRLRGVAREIGELRRPRRDQSGRGCAGSVRSGHILDPGRGPDLRPRREGPGVADLHRGGDRGHHGRHAAVEDQDGPNTTVEIPLWQRRCGEVRRTTPAAAARPRWYSPTRCRTWTAPPGASPCFAAP